MASHPFEVASRSRSAWAALRLWGLPGLLVNAAYLALADQSNRAGGAGLEHLAAAALAFVVATGWVAFETHRTKIEVPIAGILFFSFTSHLIAIFGSPFLEDDYFRYLLDGIMFLENGSPYGIAPSSLFEQTHLSPHIAPLLDGVNNPDLPTIYGPTTQGIFLLSAWLDPGNLRVLQGLMAAMSFAVILILSRRARPLPLLFIAWHPLLLTEFGFKAHPDILAVLLLLIALVLAAKPQKRPFALGSFLALAAGAKIFALLIVPAVLARSRRAWIAFTLTLGALYAPFLPSLFSHSESPLETMGNGWIFNAPLYVALQPAIGPVAIRIVLGLALIYGVSLWTLKFRSSEGIAEKKESHGVAGLRGDRIFGLMLLCSPVMNPWYLIWPLVFWVRYPTLWLGVASLGVLLSYGNGLYLFSENLAPYEISPALLTAEYALIAAALILDIRSGRA